MKPVRLVRLREGLLCRALRRLFPGGLVVRVPWGPSAAFRFVCGGGCAVIIHPRGHP